MTTIANLNNALAGAAEAVRRSLVHVRTRRGGGAGVVWRDDLVITNAHVAHRSPVSVVLLDGQAVEGRLTALDADADLAAIAVDVPGLAPAIIGDSQALRPGELAFAHGHPWGISGVVTSGAVIGVGADWPGLPAVDGRREWLVVNMRLRPGNSGGPVLDAAGRVIGIAAIMAGPNVGMAIPSHIVERFVRAHIRQREPVIA